MERLSYEQYKQFKPIWWWPLLAVLPLWWFLWLQFDVGSDTVETMANIGMEVCPPLFMGGALVFFLTSLWSAGAFFWYMPRFLNTVAEGHYCRIYANPVGDGWGMYKRPYRSMGAPKEIVTIRVGGLRRNSWITVRDAHDNTQIVPLDLRLRFVKNSVTGFYSMRVEWHSNGGVIVLTKNQARDLFGHIGPELAAAKTVNHTTAVTALLEQVTRLELVNDQQAQTVKWRAEREAWLMNGMRDAIAAGSVLANHLNDAQFSPRRRENYDLKSAAIGALHSLASMFVERDIEMPHGGLRHKLALAWHGAVADSIEQRTQELREVWGKRDLSLMLTNDVGQVEKARAALAAPYIPHVPEAPEEGSAQ